jgi:hypothetical protein
LPTFCWVTIPEASYAASPETRIALDAAISFFVFSGEATCFAEMLHNMRHHLAPDYRAPQQQKDNT